MQRSSRALLLLGACTTMCWQAAFLSPAEPPAANSRRALLAAGSAGLLGAMSPKSASAADFFGLPHIPGPFEMDPKEAVVIGDAADPQVKEAKAKVRMPTRIVIKDTSVGGLPAGIGGPIKT
ncbi:unnamed protein product [Symbiodinium sp. CCMP2592]|nr:unnamed protein product [Symbiodinium sp. CCMP2592]